MPAQVGELRREVERLRGEQERLKERLDRYERQLIAAALSAASGNVADAARRLSTDRANLYRRMRRLGLESPRHLSD